jgi:RNA polymerase sigma factor (sigma-70 family)
MDTTQLAAQLVEQTDVASGELFERVVGRIDRYFRRVIQDPDGARDCLQETLLLLQQSLQERKYDPTRSFNVWLWMKARSVYAQWCRARARQMAPLPQELAADSADARQSVDERLDAEALMNTVYRRLGPETYEAFVLYYDGELTQQEIGQIIGKNRNVVRRRIQEAHTLVKSLLGS